jgi:hypothetical protein
MTNLPKGNRLIFVGGSPRSGTTLVQNMLDSHPDILGGPELLYIPDIIDVRRKLHRAISNEWIDEFCSYDDVDQYTSTLIENLVLPLADKHGCKFSSEKTPANVLVFNDLIELFSGAHFIHVVRDPRAIISSMLQVGRRAKKEGVQIQDFTTNLSAAISYVKKCFRAGFAATERAPDRVLSIVFEQLVTGPGRETKRMCDFLGIEWSEQMLHPANKKHLGERAITKKSDQIWYDAKKYNRNPDPHEIDKWKNKLTLLQRATINASFRDFEDLGQLGYDFSINSSPTERMLTWTILTAQKIKRQFRKAGRSPKRFLQGYHKIRKAIT